MSTTIQQEADAAAWVTAPVSIEADTSAGVFTEAAVSARVTGEMDLRADCAQWITRPVCSP